MMHKYMKVLVLLLMSGALVAQEVPMTIDEEIEAMRSHIESVGEEVDTGKFKVPMSIYLLQNDKEELAARLVEEELISAYVTADIDGAMLSDYQIALSFGHVTYLSTLLTKFPENINESHLISLDGEVLPLLSMMALTKNTKTPYYENIVRMLLRAGAQPKQMDNLGLSPFTIASSVSNTTFINIINEFEQEQIKGADDTVLVNPPLSSIQLIEEQNMIDAYLELSAEENIATELLMEEWFSSIVKGYNTLADIYYQELTKRDGFSLDAKTRKGLTALQATALSSVYGGNVSYARQRRNTI